MKLYKNLSTALKEREEVRALKVSLKDKKFLRELFDFPHLEEAYLEGAAEDFPDSFMGWEKLRVLSIKFENFKGNLSPVFSLPRLENLKIIETPIKMFLLPLGKINAPLKFMSVKGCGLQLLPEEISMVTTLQELHLPNNELKSLPFGFKELKKLTRLNLDNNCFEIFPEAIKSMPGLKHLSIDSNNFSDDEKDRIQREFHIWPS